MATELETLSIHLEARVDKFEKALAKMNGTTNRHLSAMERRTGQFTNRFEGAMDKASASMRSATLAFAGGLVGGGVAGALQGISKAVGDLANVSAEAARSGLSPEHFQELSHAAAQSRVTIDALTDGMKELQLRADEFIVTGAGPGAEAFQRLGYTAEELRTKLKDPAALFEEIINKLGRLDKAAQIRIADEVFGGEGGEQFVRFLDKGADAIARARKEARDTGKVISNDLIAQAVEVDRKFNDIASTIGTNVKRAIIEAVVAAGQLSKALGGVPAALGGGNGSIPNQGETTLALGGATLPRKRSIFDEVDDIGKGASAGSMAGYRPGPPAGPTGLGDLSNVKRAGEGGKSAAERLAESYAKLRQSAQARIIDLKAEQTALGLTAQAGEALRMETELFNRATQAGLTLTPQQRSELSALAKEYAAIAASIEEANDRQQVMQDVARDAIGGIVSDLRQGTSAADAFSNALSRIADRLLDMALFGTGGGGKMGGLVGGLLAGLPKFHTGGVVPGPAGREVPIMAKGGEAVLTPTQVRALRPAGRGHSGPVSFNPVYNITPANGVTPQQLAAVLDAHDRKLVRRLPVLMAETSARYG